MPNHLHEFSPSAERILNDCVTAGTDFAEQLLMSFLREESLAGSILVKSGITLATLRDRRLGRNFAQPLSTPKDINPQTVSESATVPPLSDSLPSDLRPIVREARRLARIDADATDITSVHLLGGLLRTETTVTRRLRASGLTAESIAINSDNAPAEGRPLPVDFSISDGDQTAQGQPPENAAVRPSLNDGMPVRILDASLNRAREAFRVLEDCARFCCERPDLVATLKEARHELASAGTLLSELLSWPPVTNARDVVGDPGTRLTTSAEQCRTGLADIVEANSRRAQEALRSLEEFGKLVNPAFATSMKQLRYQSYVLHQQLLIALPETDNPNTPLRNRRLQSAALYVLVTEAGCRLPWKNVVQQLLDGGTDMIQLREKQLPDRVLIRRAAWIADACRSSGALLIINDRPDIAALCNSDGVHLGQSDCSARQARQIAGSSRLVGVSTHCRQDADAAVVAGADYLGVGPVFPSVTKAVSALAGIQYVLECAQLTVPWFAIGGIDETNVADLAAAGATRIAVSSVILASDQPGKVAKDLRTSLPTAASALAENNVNHG